MSKDSKPVPPRETYTIAEGTQEETERVVGDEFDKWLYRDHEKIAGRLKDYEERKKKYGHLDIVVTGIPTGLSALDKVTMGIQRSDFWVVQGRTGVGKTFFLCHLAHRMRVGGKKVLFINREMEPEHVMGRIDALAAKFSYQRWRQGKLTTEEHGRYRKLSEAVREMKGRVDAVPPLAKFNKDELNKIVTRYRPGPPDVVILDYLNRMDSTDSGLDVFRTTREIAEYLKNLAYRDHIPVLAAAQTNRQAVSGRKNVPGTEHLHGGDIIGWNADLVLSLFRTSRLVLHEPPLMGLRMVKYRHGEELNFILKWDLANGDIAVHKVGDKWETEAGADDEDIE